MHEFLCLEKPSREAHNLNSGALLRSVSNFKKHFFRGTAAIKAGLRKNAKALLKQEQALKKELDDLVKKGELDEVTKSNVLKEIDEFAEGATDYSARLATKVNKALDKAPTEIKDFEDLFKVKEHEWGGVYNKRTKYKAHHTTKLKDEIIWPDYILDQIENCFVTHNHPNGAGLSIADLKFFLKNRLFELRAVAPDGSVFSIRNGNIIDGNNIKFVDYENDIDWLNKAIKVIEDKYKLDKKISKEYTYEIGAKVFNEIFDLIKDKVTYTQYVK